MTVQRKYRKSGEPSVASYSFTELATGKGVLTFYPVVTSGSTLLSTKTVYNHSGGVAGTGGSGNIRANGTDLVDLDFDTEVLYPITLDGEGFVSFNSVVRRISGGSTTVTSEFIASISHYDGTTETELASGSYFLSDTLNDGESVNKEACIHFDIPKTVYSVGDTLRLTLKADGGTANSDSWILIDSKNREVVIGDYTSTFSICELNLPVLKDL